MEQTDVYKQLSAKLMMENSEILPRIWAMICNEEEARIVNSLPSTVSDLAKVFSKEETEMQQIMDSLFHKGVVFESVKEGKTYYRMPRHIVQFHDAAILWSEAPDEFIELWVDFMDNEYPRLIELVAQLKLPAFMRVIPINETIDSKSRVLVQEDAAELVRNARNLAVTTCVCRKSMKRCDAPLEVCLQLNKGADYTIKRGTGRKIDIDEALKILRISEEAGLVHTTDNRAGNVNVICNCCTCCCEILRHAKEINTKDILAPSRYQAQVNAEDCTGCTICVDYCPMNAISMNDEDNMAEINSDLCIGCGLCASNCPVEAIELLETRPEDFIPQSNRI